MIINKEKKHFVYYPSLTAGNSKSWLLKDTKFEGDRTCRFYAKDHDSLYRHPYLLVTAGGSNLSKMDFRTELGANSGQIIGDSGGYQLATGAWNWKPELLEKVFLWLEANSDLAMNLDLPPRLKFEGKFNWCLEQSIENFKYFHEHQTGKTQFLNVLQGGNEHEYEMWYKAVSGMQFNGWSVGGTLGNIQLIIYIFALMLKNKEFEKTYNDYVHLLGVAAPKHFLLLAMLQKLMNRKFDRYIQLSTDSSSPNRVTIFGTYYLDFNWKSLAYVKLDFAKSGGIEYVKDAKLPCIIDCPACRNTKFEQLMEFGDYTSMIMTMHNVYLYNHIIDKINKIVDIHDEAIRDAITNDYYKLYKSLEEMFDSANPMQVYEKYRKFYSTFGALDDATISDHKIEEFFKF